jgi:hypothetical protein
MSLSDTPLRLNDSSDDDYPDDDNVVVIQTDRQIEEDRRLAEMLAQLWEEEDQLERESGRHPRHLNAFANEMLDAHLDSSTSASATTGRSSSTRSREVKPATTVAAATANTTTATTTNI